MIPIIAIAPQIEWLTLQNARAVRDTAFLEFASFLQGGTVVWVLAAVRPYDDSGSATMPGAYVKGDTGELVTPPGAAMIVVVRGQWQRRAAHSTQPELRTAEYSWTKPFHERQRVPTWEGIYSPFIRGGVVLFTPNAGTKGIEYFGANCVLFPEWAGLVEDAFKQYESEPALQAAPGDLAQDRGRLVALCSAENHFVAIIATRKLIEAKAFRRDLLRHALTAPDEQRRAVTVFLVLTGPDDAGARDLLAEVGAALTSAGPVEQVRSVALGAFSAALDPRAGKKVQDRARALLEQVRRKQTSLGAPAQSDPTLNYILGRMTPATSSPAP
jgi:hypothetical protein